MECAKCHKFFEQVSLVDLMPPFFPSVIGICGNFKGFDFWAIKKN